MLCTLASYLLSQGPLTEAEATNYTKTSSYIQVMAYLRTLERQGAPIRIETIGRSMKGRAIPLVICSNIPGITPAEAKRRGIPVVYVQANIHAGEVEGKEAIQIILREIAQNRKDPLRKLVLVTTPMYNCDGNDAWGPALTNRGHQDGPDPVGQRQNGQGLDLNRDAIKAVAPETKAVLEHVYRAWDPVMTMDLHTTNGTRHGYLMTYAPPTYPVTDPNLLKFNVDLLAGIRTAAKHGYALQDYGNYEGDSWRTFGYEPRYVTNYVALRNRFTALSEAASFQPFKTRVDVTRDFVRDVLEPIAQNPKPYLDAVRAADAAAANLPGSQLGVEFEMASRGTEKLILEDPDAANPIPPNKAPVRYKTIEAPIFDRFVATRSTTVPIAYLIDEDQKAAIELLRLHGVRVERVGPGQRRVEMFALDKGSVKQSGFQGLKLWVAKGQWTPGQVDYDGSFYRVPMNQPLARLAFTLLDPESPDSVFTWGYLGDLSAATQFPIWRETN